jgi:hypothetical protein
VSEIEGQMTVSNVEADMIVHPRTGELLDLKTVQTDALLEARDLLSDHERQTREVRRSVDDELIRRADHEGRRSITFSEFTVEVTAPTEKQWDMRALRETLATLVERDLISDDKRRRCIRFDPKIVWAEVKTLLSDPRVRGQIEACYEEVEARRYVKVSRRG